MRLGEPVERVVVSGGRASGVLTASGSISSRHAVLAACDAQILYGQLVDEADLPPSFLARMRQFRRANSTVKVNYTLLAQTAPWVDRRAVGAGTVHVADSLEELSTTSAELANRLVPADPFLLIGQTTTADPTRSPPGTESMWMYTHVPQVARGDGRGEIDVAGPLAGDAARTVRGAHGGSGRSGEHRVPVVDHRPPGAGTGRPRTRRSELRSVETSAEAPPSCTSSSVFRPVPGLARAETPITSLYLASSSAHPGGSVHGACGANAARAALLGRRVTAARRLALVLGGRRRRARSSAPRWRRHR